MKYRNHIELSGNISRLNTDSEKSVWLDIAQNYTFKNKEGIDVETTSFFNARLYKDKYEELKDIIEVGSPVIIKGLLKNYIDNSGNKISYIQIFEIEKIIFEKNNEI